jgi:hypothetical protein
MSNIRKLKKLPYELIDRFADPGRGLYQLMSDLIDKNHDDLKDARIALAWAMNWEPDVDGRIRLGAAQRASDLSRELAPYDFCILLSRKFFDDKLTTERMRTAALDRELTKCAIKYDADGEPVEDEKGRKVYRLRDWDIKEFSAIVERYGPNITRESEQFIAAVDRAREASGDYYVGAQNLQQRLRAADVDIALDVIRTWTEQQRRDADVWARVVLYLKERDLDAVEAEMPAHVAEATNVRRDSQGELPVPAATH